MLALIPCAYVKDNNADGEDSDKRHSLSKETGASVKARADNEARHSV